ncbi:MFS transporter [Pseudomonas sp. NPDC089407]|uniref:MFS transporter n=1 Tax=Pseudomonas sp. NPDC089407 TaxID=3364464 RepID=UPI003850EC0F
MLAAYRDFINVPGTKGLIVASAIARLPQAMFAIGIITLLAHKTGQYWLAGSVAGTFTLANALFAPKISKLVDLYGQYKILPVVTACSTGMMLGLIVAIYLEASITLLFLLAALAGLMPSMPAMTRARWMHMFQEKHRLHTAFSVDTVLTELAYIIGPPLAIGLSTHFYAETGPLMATLLLVFGVTAVLAQRNSEPQVVNDSASSANSVLFRPGIRTMVFSLLAMGGIGGAIDVAVVAYANEQGWPGSASFILAAYALGSMIAGLLFGAIKLSLPIEKQFLLGILVTGLTAILPLFSSSVYALAVLLFFAGVSFAPTMVVTMNLGAILIPASRATEGFTWMTTGLSVGVAIGAAVSGVFVDIYGARAGFGGAIGAGLIMVMVVLSGFGSLRKTVANSAVGADAIANPGVPVGEDVIAPGR